jgi:tetratricopeptide (TPR) repeat protein
MFNIKEFYKARERLFENQNNIHALPDLQDYLLDLDMVCANERSKEMADLLSALINIAKPLNDNQVLFELYWQYFLQTYYYVKQLNKTEFTIDNMKQNMEETNNMEQISRIFQAESLINQLKGNKKESIEFMHKALEVIETHKDDYPEIYYSALYAYSHFSFLQNKHSPKVEVNMEKCLRYYSKSYNMRGLNVVINQLLRFYLHSGNVEKIEKLLEWVFEKEQLHKRMLDNHLISFYWFLGTMNTIRNKLTHAIEYLNKAYSKIKEQKLQQEMMYEYTDILKFLSRCYAHQGKFQLAHDLLIELASFMEDENVKSNYFARGKWYIFVSSYYTLLFIFIQLDLNIEDVKDEKLRRIYEHTNSLLSKFKISEKLILSAFSDDKNIQEIFENNIDKSETEVSIILQQLLLTHVPYKSKEKSVQTIEKLREYAIDPLYADILIGKILISMGNYDKFREIVNKIVRETTETKAPILKIWRDFYVLLRNYLDESDNKNVIEGLVKLEEHCRRNNFFKMGEEIKMYHRLISFSRTINQFTDKIKQTAFMDMYDKESRRMAMEYLESKES